ncbi:hypothetical protein [Streptomyces sp. G-5]|uniref:hypothetical protein n=1 Tax=Streptomyces sp. G-5 TaxID=2977231 RepID=UPI0021D3D653|nr:hypothetical protein [Streptomyces sp. G-5]MCU4750053.1 hypothetical protein [Streptomyces sp. G-5]
MAEPEPSTAVFQTRAGLAALDLTTNQTGPGARLTGALANAAALDAYAAREVLAHATAHPVLNSDQRRTLEAAVTASGLGAGLAEQDTKALTEAAATAESALRSLL